MKMKEVNLSMTILCDDCGDTIEPRTTCYKVNGTQLGVPDPLYLCAECIDIYNGYNRIQRS